MSNTGPNMIHAMDLAHLEDMNVVTNGLGESVIQTPDGDITDVDIMVGLYGNRTITGNSADFVIIDSTEPFDPDHRDEHDWKRDKFVSGPATPPSDAKRAKLRAKRKKRK